MTVRSMILTIVVIAAAAGLLLMCLDWAPQRDTPSLSRNAADTLVEGASRPTLAGAGNGTPARDVEPGAPSPVDFESIDRARDLHGVVVRANGTPIANARLQVVVYPWRYRGFMTTGGHWREELGTAALTAPDGSFAIRLPSGSQVHLRVRAQGFAPVEYSMLQAGEKLRVVMREPVRLRVLATSADGQHVQHLKLVLRCGGRSAVTFRREGETDSLGACAFGDLPPGSAVVLSADPGAHQGGRPAAASLSLPHEGELTYRLILPPGRTLRGQVTDAQTGLPVEGARVGMGVVAAPWCPTDPEGRYCLPGWTGQDARHIHVVASGYARAQRLVGDDDVLNFRLERGFLVRGRVLGNEGQPVALALVSCASDPTGGLDQLVSAADGKTDESGAFALTGLRSDLQHSIAIHAPGCRGWFGVLPAPQAGVVELGDLRLGSPCTLFVRVTSSRGEPIPRVPLQLAQIEPANAMRHYGLRWRRHSDDLGRAQFVDLAPGVYRLEAQPDARQWASEEVLLDAGAAQAQVAIALPAGRAVRLEVVDDRGGPVPGCWIQASSIEQTGQGVKARVDEMGRCLIHLPQQDMILRVWPRPRSGDRFLPSEPIEIDADATSSRVVLTRAATITGRVLNPEGMPVPGAQIEVHADGTHVSTLYADQLGRFEYETRPGVVLDLKFTGRSRNPADGIPWPQTLPWGECVVERVLAGTRDVTIRAPHLTHERSLIVCAYSPDGHPVPGVVVQLKPGPAEPITHSTGSGGSVRIDGLRAVETEMSLLFCSTREQPWRSPAAQAIVPDGQTVDVHLLPGAAIRGVLLNVSGAPAKGGGVFVYVDGVYVSWAKIEENGRFTAVVDPSETRQIDLQATGRAPGGRELWAKIEDVRPGAADVILRFEVLR